MSAEIAMRDEQPAEVAQRAPAPSSAAESALVLWAYEARQAAQIATSLAKTSFVPASLRGKPEDVTAAILAGQELGLRPMAALRSMDIIQGTPALRAHAMRGLVQSHGHRVWLVEQTPQRVIMRGQRREADGTYGEVQTSEWTINRAAQLGLTTKQEWKRQPQTMLTARATGEICRLVASDVLYAMPYAAEELHDREPVRAEASTQPVTAAEILGAVSEQAGDQPPAVADVVDDAPTNADWPVAAEPGGDR